MLRVGVDLVDVAEVERSVAALGDRFERRALTAREIEAGPAHRRRRCAYVAELVAAKEAVIKVLGPDEGVDWRSIDVGRPGIARISVTLSGRASELARGRGIADIDVSVSSAGGQAMAVAFGRGPGEDGLLPAPGGQF